LGPLTRRHTAFLALILYMRLTPYSVHNDVHNYVYIMLTNKFA